MERTIIAYLPAASLPATERTHVPGHLHVDWENDLIPCSERGYFPSMSAADLTDAMRDDGWEPRPATPDGHLVFERDTDDCHENQ